MRKHIYQNQLDINIVMNVFSYDEENMLLTDRSLWWKPYQNHALEELR